ncbi:hypothetical protein GLX30_32405 [Streptomyces sp. Tu 2975]|uniref:hypothetical protein n=1 Tax=Streptomyces sp. Tu 2975 TaxID=2676871 RepID=UPI00135784C5|nr:hypothetical protein [Streptomyces sp. Tu 2975]QIP87946.1 hypothetical protein GLX30_32405 [Streptomyces sp. Tu 2975]
MGDLPPLLVFTGCLAAIMGFFVRIAAHVRRRGLAGAAVRAALASHDEAFRVTAHESYYEIRAQADRQGQALSPDGRWTPDRDGAKPAGSGSRRPRGARQRRRLRDFRRFAGGPGRGR